MDIEEASCCFGTGFAVDGFVGHGEVVLADCCATLAAEVDGELFGVLFDDVGDAEAWW